MIYTMAQLRERTVDVDGCWVFTGALAGKGYGVVADDRERYVHRLAVLLDGRELLPGMQAAHTCGETRCCNPSHILVCDQSTNETHKIAHGTYRHGNPGVTHCGARLDPAMGASSKRCKLSPHTGPCQ